MKWCQGKGETALVFVHSEEKVDISPLADTLTELYSDQTWRVLQRLFTDAPTRLPTACSCNKAIGSASSLVIRVKSPLHIIDIGCDDVGFFQTLECAHTRTQSWSAVLSGD